MPIQTSEVGSLPLAVGQYNISINAAVLLTAPTPNQLRPVSAGANYKAMGGLMTCLLSVETQNARFTMDGTTPTAVNGVLLPAPGFIAIRGLSQIANFRIIGVAAGGIINYTFTVDDIN